MSTTNSQTAVSATVEASARFRAFEADLNAVFVERREEIRALILALIAGEHVLLLGDPGTGKSALTNAFSAALSGKFFGVLMTRFTVPEEVFGPISLMGLDSDQYRRVTTGYLPEASVAFLDEVFKANSAILNSMLTILNERAYDNGGARSPVPLQLCVGASNEYPEDSTLNALFDRFLLRRWVSPIANADAFRRLLSSRAEPKVTTTISAVDLDAVRELAAAVEVPDRVIDAVMAIKDDLSKAGINVSDRRWRKMMKLICASAALAGRSVADPIDVLALIDALWRKHDERPAIAAVVIRRAAPELADAQRIFDAAIELYNGATKDVAILSRNTAELKMSVIEIRKLNQTAPVADLTARVVGMHQDLLASSMRKMAFPS